MCGLFELCETKIKPSFIHTLKNVVLSLDEQLRYLAELAGTPEEEPRYSKPHTIQGLQEELQNISAGIQSLLHSNKSQREELERTKQNLALTEHALEQERIKARIIEQKMKRAIEITNRYKKSHRQ